MMKQGRIVTLILTFILLFNTLFGSTRSVARVQAAGALRTDAVVLVNSASAYYADFQHYIQVYLDHFGIPYTVVDIAVTAVPSTIGDYALIVVGHRQLDINGTYLSSAEETLISSAVNGGSGLVNFDNDLTFSGSTGRYGFISTIFGFGYKASQSLSNIAFPTGVSHYITQKHAGGETYTTQTSMTVAGITLPATATALVNTGTSSAPLLVVSNYGGGRGVQWGSYNWMSHSVRGPLMGLDDVVWRSLVWAARKPFTMQGMPPFATYRMDDVTGPLDWVHISNAVGFKPWLGIFINQIDATEAADIKNLVDSGNITTSIHAFDQDPADGSFSNFFYFDHKNGRNFSDTQLASNFATGDKWFSDRGIKPSSFLVPHYYEVGTNALNSLNQRGVQFIATMMNPGQLESTAPWMMAGPFRQYETGTAYDRNHNIYYSAPLPTDNRFFNCVSEFRDADLTTHYEWDPTPTDISGSIQRGTKWLTDGLDGMDLATLYTHEYMIYDVDNASMQTIMQGIVQNIASYNPIYVTVDYGCQYARAVYNSNITAGTYDATAKQVTVTLGGTTDMPTKFYVFSDQAGSIQQTLVDVPTFSNSTQVVYTVPGQLDHIVVSPNPASVVLGTTQQFTAQGYDASGTLIPNLPVTWSVVNGGGSISTSGLFTAGLTVGSYANTVVATSAGIQGAATVNLTAPVLDHFSFDAITSPKYTGLPFQITIRARDVNQNRVATYSGQATLSDTTGTIQPTAVTFSSGVWTGNVTIGQANSSVIITVRDGTYTGTSGAFAVNAAKTCPCTIWDNTSIPATADQNINDSRAIETGVKFRADADGYVTGLRFYKGSSNTGTHTGHLWDAAGNLLATAVFTGETANGWQQVSLSSAVAIKAGTTYVASYFSPSGWFSETATYFTTAVVNTPLKALANGEDGVNGVYRYDTSGFPTLPWAGYTPNYWVDVVYDTKGGLDTTPPTVTSTIPVNSSVGINITDNISATFSEPLDSATVNSTTFALRDLSNNLVASTVAYGGNGWTATLTPTASLSYSTTYRATVKGGASGIKDVAGNPLSADVSWTFTTSAPPPPPADDGPGGPILILSSTSNLYSRYYTEILKAEGLNEYLAKDISTVTPAILAGYSVVVLGDISLTAAQVTMLTDWVNAGGNLIAMHPDQQLAGLLGLTGPAGTRSNAYLLIDTSQSPGLGSVNTTIQYHGSADLYALNGARSIASLYSDATTATTNPAITMRDVGTSGGQAAAFTYDLARSVIATRQGNQAWAGQERDGTAPIRSDDLFFGNASFDPQKNWIDLNKVAIPQADEQQRLLAKMITSMALDRMPLPHFWYLPRGAKAAVLMTGDDHTGGYSDDRFNQFVAASPANCSVNNWECIRASAYLYPGNPMTSTQATNFTNQGFEVGLHVTTGCADYTPSSLASYYTNQFSQFKAQYPTLTAPVSERTHCIAWSDWSTQPKVELQNGMRLDTNYYYWPPSWVGNTPGLFTGSGFPMRFADTDGSLIDVYQAATQMTDESGQTYPYTVDTLLDRALGAEGYYGVFTTNFHNDTLTSAEADATVNSAKTRGVPVISGRQLLTWLDGRNNSAITNLTWNTNTLSFSVTFGTGSNGLQVLLPNQASTGQLSGLTLNGAAVSYTLQTIKGVDYATFIANAGTYQAVYSSTPSLLVISNISATSGSSSSATIIWTTNRVANSQVTYGTNSSQLNQTASDTNLVSSHSITLTGLTAGTQYYYRVTSTETGGASVTSPAVGSAPASFTTQTATASITDTTAADFSAGTVGTTTYISQVTDGEVVLAPVVGQEFSGTSLPADWTNTAWTGGTSSVSGGQLTVDGSMAATSATYAAGRSLEFVATFGGEAFEHIGFGQTLQSFGESWAMFSTLNTSSTLYARINNAGTSVDTPISGSWTGTPHRFRIDWNSSSVVFSIDGTVVSTQNVAITASMRPLVSDYSLGGATVRVDWLRMTPYAASGSFSSRILDAGSLVNWTTISWNYTLPTGTGLALFVRTGSTSTPDGTWSAFAQIPSSGSSINAASRYLQYRADLSTTNTSLTPVLSDVNITNTPATGTNQAPVALNDSYSTAEDTVLTVAAPGVLGNDSDPDGNAITAVLVNGPTHGTLTLNGDGSFTYTPAANYNGSDSFTYKASDGSLTSNTATVALTITPVNDAPVAANDAYTTAQDAALTVAAPGVLGNDTDIDSTTLTSVLVTAPAHGTLTLNANGSFTFIPAAGYNGADSFTYKASDGSLTSNTATVSLTITPVNRAPVAANDSYSTAEDTALTVATPGVLGNDSDPDSNPITAVLVTGPTHGTLTLNANGSFTYTPAANYNGSDSFTYNASDGLLTSNTATVTLTITPVNDAPVATNDIYTTAEDTALTVAVPGVLINDTDIDSTTLTALLVTGSAHGTLTLNANGSFSYTPALNYNGPDSFTYQANDGSLNSNTATVSLTITPVNDPPVAGNDAYTVYPNTALTIASPGVLTNDTDVDSATLTAVVVTSPVNGTLALNANGSFTYTPTTGYSGTDSFTYTASDGQATSNTATVTLTVLADRIFADGFESGNLANWTLSTNGSGALAVNTTAKLVGTYGMQATISSNTGIFVTDDSPNAEKRYRARFYFDPNSIVMANGNAHYLFVGYSGASTSVLVVELRFQNRAYQVRAGAINDSNAWTYTNWFTIADSPHYIELNWQASATPTSINGVLTLWTDGVQRASLTTINNDTWAIDRVQLGAVSGIDTGTRGTYYFDQFESRRVTYVGP